MASSSPSVSQSMTEVSRNQPSSSSMIAGAYGASNAGVTGRHTIVTLWITPRPLLDSHRSSSDPHEGHTAAGVCTAVSQTAQRWKRSSPAAQPSQ